MKHESAGHTCLSGHNEVVMLRRLPDEHKFNATKYLENEALYALPHDDAGTRNGLNTWPTVDTIAEWEHMK